MRNKNNKSSGFTIIEVLIVLAIAGLIMLIVFLAVPALQRNSHNTSTKNDVSNIMGAMNEFANNNNGAVATTASLSGTTVTIGSNCGTTGANCATANVSQGVTKVDDPSSSINTAKPDLGEIKIFTTAKCDGNTPTSSGATPRNYVAYYQLEGGAVQCTAS